MAGRRSTTNRQRRRHPSLALVVPAVLFALGAWQISRVQGAADGFEARAAGLQGSLDRLHAFAAREPGATVRFKGDDTPYAAAEAAERVGAGQAELRRDAVVQRARLGAAWASAVGGGMALLAALLCFAATALAATRGRRSRPGLISAFRAVLRALPPLLGCVAVSLAVGIIGAVLFEAGGLWFANSIGTGELKLLLSGLIIAVAAAAFAVRSVWQLRRALDAFTPQPLRVLGRAAAPADAPGLWAFVREVAAEQRADAPDNLVLGTTDGFFVTASRVLLLPEQRELSGRTLYLPATFAALLSRAEITAIVAHELAHFTGEDTAYSQHFLPLFAGMARSVEAVMGRRSAAARSSADGLFQPAFLLAGHVLSTFERVVRHWSRLREFEADRASLRATGGGRGAATALLRIGVGGGIVANALQETYKHPQRADRDVVGAVLARAAALGFADPTEHLEDRQPHPTDTHPPARQRIEALGVAVDDALLAEASRPVRPEDLAFIEGLFADWHGFRRALGDDLLEDAREHDQRLQAALEEAASAVAAEVPVHERFAFVVGLLAAFGATMLAGGAFFAWIVPGFAAGDTSDLWYAVGFAAVLGVGGLLLLWAAWGRYRRAKVGPFIVVGTEGFRCDGVAGVVPWSAVDGVRVTTGQRFVTTFHFEPSAPLPAKAGRRWYVKVNQRRRTLELHGYVPRGMSAQAFLDLLNRAWRAHQAQALLRERDALNAAGVTAAPPTC